MIFDCRRRHETRCKQLEVPVKGGMASAGIGRAWAKKRERRSVNAVLNPPELNDFLLQHEMVPKELIVTIANLK